MPDNWFEKQKKNAYGNNPFNPGNKLSRVQKAKKRTQQRTGSGFDDLGQLENMLKTFGSMGAPDISSFKAQLFKAISGEYDPKISGVKKSMGNAKKRAGDAKKDIGALYNDLANYYTGQVAPTKANTKAGKAEAQHRSKALSSSITDDYTSRLREQVDMYKQLGIEAAAPSATEGQSADQANQQAIAEMTAGAEQAALNTQGQADASYWSEGAGIAHSEGTELQGDITASLTSYLNEQESKLADLQGMKKSAYNSGMIQLQQQAAESAAKQQTELWNRMLELAKLKQSMAGAASKGMDLKGGFMGASQALGNDQRLMNEFNTSLSRGAQWRNTPTAKAAYGGHAPSSPEEWAEMIKNDASYRKLSPQDQIALWKAALAYFGRQD